MQSKLQFCSALQFLFLPNSKTAPSQEWYLGMSIPLSAFLYFNSPSVTKSIFPSSSLVAVPVNDAIFENEAVNIIGDEKIGIISIMSANLEIEKALSKPVVAK
ncbi:hypothetical protein Adt_41781 [Abeliophyllum distichum]|uniref:Uncharacterized protein n=1 Tax=Abeliophyllum distichum TaxID=126358 RepID=A0ABD1PPT1_9LAMI